MAAHRIPILGANTIPDASGDVFLEPYSVKATNDLWEHLVAIFNDTATRIGLRGGFVVPKNYIGSAKIIVIWTSTAIAGDVEWDYDYRAIGGNDTESLDQATPPQETVNQNDTAPSAAHERMVAELSLTDGNFAVDDFVEFELFRDGTDAGDTMAAAAIVHAVLFEYSDV
jgi:putative transposon-encoded protein